MVQVKRSALVVAAIAPAGVGALSRAEGLAALLPHGRAQRDSVGGALPEDVPADQGRHRWAAAAAATPAPTDGEPGCWVGSHSNNLLPASPLALPAAMQTAWASSWCSRARLTRPTAPAPPPSAGPAWRKACGACCGLGRARHCACTAAELVAPHKPVTWGRMPRLHSVFAAASLAARKL